MKQIAVCLILNDLHRPSPPARAKYFRITLSSSLTLQIQCHEILLVLPSEQIQNATTASPPFRAPSSLRKITIIH